MFIKKETITKIDMVENEHNDFCVRFYIDRVDRNRRAPNELCDDWFDYGRDGCIILPCFWAAGFGLDDPGWEEAKAEQIRLTQEYLDQYPDDAYVELNSGILYGMNVYH